MYQIEKHIPLPDQTKGRRKLYDFGGMDVGDSFFVACEQDEQKRMQRNVLGSARAKRHAGKDFVVLTGQSKDGQTGVRCWRVE